MLTIRASMFCHLTVSAPTGRTYEHQDEQIGCSTCDPVPVLLNGDGIPHPSAPEYRYSDWTAACEAAKHNRHRTYKSAVFEPNPAEAKQATNLAGDVRRKLAAVASYNAGSGRLFVSPERSEAFFKELAKLRAQVLEDNAGMTTARVEISALFGKLDPDAADVGSKESLVAAKEAIDAGIAKILEAMKSGDRTVMNEVVRETKMLASMLDGDAGKLATETGNFLARAAERLKDAAKMGEAHVALAVEDARKGAARFGSLWAEMGLSTDDAPEIASVDVKGPGPDGNAAPAVDSAVDESANVKPITLAALPANVLDGLGDSPEDLAQRIDSAATLEALKGVGTAVKAAAPSLDMAALVMLRARYTARLAALKGAGASA